MAETIDRSHQGILGLRAAPVVDRHHARLAQHFHDFLFTHASGLQALIAGATLHHFQEGVFPGGFFIFLPVNGEICLDAGQLFEHSLFSQALHYRVDGDVNEQTVAVNIPRPAIGSFFPSQCFLCLGSEHLAEVGGTTDLIVLPLVIDH